MENKYYLSVNDGYEFQVGPEEAKDLDVSRILSEKTHVIHNHKSYSVALLETNFPEKNYTLKVNGNTYKVTIAQALDQQIKKMGLSLGNASVKDEIYAPMPGIILEVNVAEGEEVKKGDFLCVLEAMKMENTLSAPRDGIVKSIHITKGETVDKGKLLIELEKND